MWWSVRLPWPSDFQAGWPWVTETVDEGGYCHMALVIYTQQPTFLHLLDKITVVDKHLKVQTMSRLCFEWRTAMSNRMDRMILSPMQLTGHMPKYYLCLGWNMDPHLLFACMHFLNWAYIIHISRKKNKIKKKRFPFN